MKDEISQLSKGRRRRAISNPNKKFMTLVEALVAEETMSESNQAIEETGAVEDVIEVGGMQEDEGSNSEAEELPVVHTRTGCEVKIPRKY